MEQEENKWKVKVDESQKTIKQVFKKEELRAVILKVWALDQQHQRHLGTCYKCMVGSHSGLTESDTLRG